MTFRLDLPDESAMDYWAYDEVCRAIEAGLVPNELQNQYRSNITRADFALLMTEVAATITGKDVEQLVLDTTGKTLDEWVASYPFSDTTDRNVIAANALGILNGRGNGIFDPYASIQRQEAATMLLRGAVAIKADALEGWADKIAQSTIQFADGAAFAPYAQEAIRVMAALDVMKGTGNNRFSPHRQLHPPAVLYDGLPADGADSGPGGVTFPKQKRDGSAIAFFVLVKRPAQTGSDTAGRKIHPVGAAVRDCRSR